MPARRPLTAYTQDSPPPSTRIDARLRNPHDDDSNYRANVSRPRWVTPPAAR